jgi:D-glycero-beta-D-manno-heptose 1-phosphate adenylyltransferase
VKIPTELHHYLETIRAQGQEVTLVTGVFDILHQEHLKFLEKAKSLGRVVVVGLESDLRVRQIKGEGRPINSAVVRQKNLQETDLPDYVFLLPDQFSTPQDHEDLIAQIRPRYLAVSSHTKHLEKKDAILKRYGGEVRVVHQHNPEISTTILVNAQK